MSEEEKINGELAKKVMEDVEAFHGWDAACDKIKEKGICDAVGVKCDLSCKIYVKKDKLLKLIEECIKAQPLKPVLEVSPMVSVVRPAVEPEEPKEKRCPSCGVKAARPDSKYCDYCGEEF